MAASRRELPGRAPVYIGTCSAGWREDGKRRRVTVYASSQAECIAKLAEKRGEVAAGALADPGQLTVGDLLDRYLEHAWRNVRGTTDELYTKALRKHVRPHLGGAPLRRLAPLHVLDWLGALEREQVGARMRQVAFDALKRACAFGTDLGLLGRNPAAKVKRPWASKSEVEAHSAHQARALLDAARAAEPWVEVGITLLLSGLRIGECFALSWADVDVDAGAVHVRKPLVEVGGERKLTEPKTTSSKRRVPLPDFAVRALRRYRASPAATPLPAVLLFSAPDGGPVWVGNYRRLTFANLVKKAKLPGSVTPHKLRHTAATLGLGAGADVRSVASLLGHDKPSITWDTYSHAFPERVEAAARKLARSL